MIVSRDDSFYSARARLERAEQKISELDTSIFKYRTEKPPAFICEPDPPNHRTKTYKFKFAAPFPDSWTHLPIEILEATRSALDQCAYAAAKLSGNTRLKRTQFPIADTLDDFNNLISGRKVCQDVPDVIVKVFRRFKPYKGGNDDLWALNKLRNSTHTQLIPLVVLGGNIWIHHYGFLTDQLTGLNPVFDSVKRELPFARADIDENFEFTPNVTINIGFDKPEITGSHDAVTFLTAAVNEVEHVIKATEIVCERFFIA
jgi:hypothetical protein